MSLGDLYPLYPLDEVEVYEEQEMLIRRLACEKTLAEANILIFPQDGWWYEIENLKFTPPNSFEMQIKATLAKSRTIFLGKEISEQFWINMNEASKLDSQVFVKYWSNFVKEEAIKNGYF